MPDSKNLLIIIGIALLAVGFVALLVYPFSDIIFNGNNTLMDVFSSAPLLLFVLGGASLLVGIFFRIGKRK
jgi:hypothetical protein